jgi:dTDP-L-rhamnose 4-epimerase
MKNTILVTGGAGFIGSHVVDELIRAGYKVRVLDNLTTSIHGAAQRRPKFLHPDAELILGDIQDTETVRRVLVGVHGVCHLASVVGVGQSMMDVRSYTTANTVGTAVLMDGLIEHPVDRLVVASSMNVYGEGSYQTSDGTPADVEERSPEALRAGIWEPKDSSGTDLVPVPTSEQKPPALAPVYALSKYSQERLCLMLGKEYGIGTVALRIFSAYGPRQFILKPYAGVLSVFASRLMNHSSPIIYEDGNQLRDFIHVRDVARAFRLALESDDAAGRVINIGTGKPNTIRGAAHLLARYMNRTNVKFRITGRHRNHDVRHCYADTQLARELLNFDPTVTFDDGVAEMANWLEDRISYDREPAGVEIAS